MKDFEIPKFITQLNEKAEKPKTADPVFVDRPSPKKFEKPTVTKTIIHLNSGKVIETDGIWEENGIVKFVRFGTEMGYPKASIARIETRNVESAHDIIKDYRRPKYSESQAKSDTRLYEIWYNSRLWGKKEEPEEGVEYVFQHNSRQAYAILSLDQTTRNDSELFDSAMENVGWESGYKLLHKDKRIVNGAELTCLEVRGKLGERRVIYLGYFWSGDSGTIHFLSVADENVFNTFKPDIIDILNGLVIMR